MKTLRAAVTVIAIVAILFSTASAQNGKDTIKTSVPADPMVVDPGKTSDGMNVTSGKPDKGMVVISDTGFINKNIEDNLMEIALAKQGMRKGNAQVKKIAATIITDHTALLKQLQQLASKRNASKINASEMKTPTVEIEAGNNYSSAWASQMLNMHVQKITELESYMATMQDVGIKRLAGMALPKIRMHKQMLMQIPGAKVTKLPNAAVQ